MDNCITCSQYCPLPKSFSYETNKVSSPFHQVSIDVIGPLPKTFHSNKFIIIAIDHFTKWIEALAVNNTSATTSALFIHNYIIACHGCPHSLLSDNGKNFIADALKSLLKLLGIKQQFTVPYTPSTNGMVERVNGSLVSILKKLSTDHPS